MKRVNRECMPSQNKLESFKIERFISLHERIFGFNPSSDASVCLRKEAKEKIAEVCRELKEVKKSVEEQRNQMIRVMPALDFPRSDQN
jgi:hypothetical protein